MPLVAMATNGEQIDAAALDATLACIAAGTAALPKKKARPRPKAKAAR